MFLKVLLLLYIAAPALPFDDDYEEFDIPCGPEEFMCDNGECVDINKLCDDKVNCIDKSSEHLCRKEADYKCFDGEVIPEAGLCDGFADCFDCSDESKETCLNRTCPSFLFKCPHGACVDDKFECREVQKCRGGVRVDEFNDSDDSYESDDYELTLEPINWQTESKPPSSAKHERGKCLLPPQPKNGFYTVGGNPNAQPGQSYKTVFLDITCNQGFDVEDGKRTVHCHNGDWSGVMPACVRLCRLFRDNSVQYNCLYNETVPTSRTCGAFVPSGTTVKPLCRTPNYYSQGTLQNMKCNDGNWNYVAKCKPECGRITPDGIQLVVGGKSATRGELPWHVGIYSKTTRPYSQICGGSLISTTTVISAAHCFWSDVNKLLPASEFAVAAGKLYKHWEDPRDKDAQLSNVADIKVTAHFRGAATNFQHDIALVIVSSPFTYQVFIRPVCLDFDVNFDKLQLSEGNSGKVAGWGLTSKNGGPSQVLKVVSLPYISVIKCFAISPPSFKEFITADKICAGYTKGTALCQGDSGGGLAFPANKRGTLRYYLRGIVSTAPRNQDLCSTNTFTAFTQIVQHEHFIKTFSIGYL